jgi:hypothetical protein
MRTRLRAIKEELQRRMHEPIPLQGKWLRQVVRGYFAYHAVPTNGKTIRHPAMDVPTAMASEFRRKQAWHRVLGFSERSKAPDGDPFIGVPDAA